MCRIAHRRHYPSLRSGVRSMKRILASALPFQITARHYEPGPLAPVGPGAQLSFLSALAWGQPWVHFVLMQIGTAPIHRSGRWDR